ncbi:MAG: hypothetical protein IJX97_06200 [Clostridia bacterium]|nr:hypothetical protein [Clostridia bacterium]
MKKKIFGVTFKKILAGIGCLILALLFWLVVRYGEAGGLPIILFGIT